MIPKEKGVKRRLRTTATVHKHFVLEAQTENHFQEVTSWVWGDISCELVGYVYPPKIGPQLLANPSHIPNL